MRRELVDELLSMPKIAAMLRAASVGALLEDFASVRVLSEQPEIDWDWALLVGSALTGSQYERAQDAVLRIAQACLTRTASDAEERAAATLLLERVSNRPAIELAIARSLSSDQVLEDVSASLGLDVIRSRLENTIPLESASLSRVNRFQREFWTAAETNKWLSFSAPTSSGKSFIVRQWFEYRMSRTTELKGVFVVPTRALIDEVSKGLRSQFDGDVGIYVFPWDAEIGTRPKELLVLTQERLHLLQQRLPDYPIDIIFIDEAQKFDDDARGVLLEQVITEAARRAPDAQLLLASPFSENPELLVQGAPASTQAAAIVSPTLTVVQNLLWLNQRPRRPTEWMVELILDGEPVEIGTISLPARPSPDSKRLPFVPVALGGNATGNIVYVNGASSAEKTAMQIHDALGPEAETVNPDVSALVELSDRTVHPQYALGVVLRRGIAFHYGNMPSLLRSEIERLFREGTLKYLICTSTLLEGVNLPCKNLFVRGPRRGTGRPMTPADFWNLAGRAGRWGMEFQGNIVCVDTTIATQWPNAPQRRVRYPLRRATTAALTDAQALRAYIAAGTPPGEGQGSPPLEGVFSYLASRLASDLPISTLPGMAAISAGEVAEIETLVRAALESVDIPGPLLVRHAGISPLSMQRLLHEFRSEADPSSLAIPAPESVDAIDQVVRAIALVARTLGGSFGPAGGRQFMLAQLIVHWMRGYALARIIAERIAYRTRNGLEYRLASLIRDCMSDVEQIARFEAPKYLACYVDLLKLHYEQIGVAEEMPDLPDIAMLLELGVSRKTELSLMSLGLSRSTAVALSEFIADDELTAAECIEWLRARDFEPLNLPKLVVREVAVLLTQTASVAPADPSPDDAGQNLR